MDVMLAAERQALVVTVERSGTAVNCKLMLGDKFLKSIMGYRPELLLVHRVFDHSHNEHSATTNPPRQIHRR